MHYITSTKALIQAVEHILDLCPTYVSVDTEFLRQSSYYPKVGLIQIGYPDNVIVIDALSCDLSPLGLLLYHSDIIKVFHSARQDIEIFYNHFGSVPQPIADLQINARYLGWGQQVSLNALVVAYLNELPKEIHTYDRWLKRPLHPDLLDYAYNDGRYIYALYPIMQKMLEESNNMESPKVETQALLQWPETLRNQENILKKAHHDLKDNEEIEKFNALVLWREKKAQQHDKPRLHIVRDKTLCNLIKINPIDKKNYKSILYAHDPRSLVFKSQTLRQELYHLIFQNI